ncbi:D-alanyl-D-alanine carboxypeptidase family protein [Halobacillus fulvus]|nr:D-alanyl-D-alanine carboxypeptidase family protein [Halobacillus fulvus]
MKRQWIIIAGVLTLTACSNDFLSGQQPPTSTPSAESQKKVDVKDQPVFETVTEEIGEDGLVIVGDPESVEVVVNKERKLPEGYIPPDLRVPDVSFSFDEDHPKKQMRAEAAGALERLFKAAEAQGIELVAASGYRSYERQKSIYERNVEVYGEEETNTFSAKPGTSEHQTGLAMDVTSAAMAFRLDQSFIDTPEGSWLADNAHQYGFVIRYPEGKTDITGYTYEPWHLRYVGKETAIEVYKQESTLEEFFGHHPS